jgi:hypothetical protein
MLVEDNKACRIWYGICRKHDYMLRVQNLVLELGITNMATVRIFEVIFDKNLISGN